MKIDNDVIIASLKSEQNGILINRIQGSRLLKSSLPGLALPHDSTSVLKALPGKPLYQKTLTLYSLSVYMRIYGYCWYKNE